MGRNIVETVMGAVVLLIAGIFLVFAYTSSTIIRVPGYEVVAKFNSIEGLSSGSDVRLAGIKIGSVTKQELDTEDYRAEITLTVREDISLPVDTRASITSDGLLGANYLRLELGRKKEYIKKTGGEITKTRDVVTLEELLGKVIFLLTKED